MRRKALHSHIAKGVIIASAVRGLPEIVRDFHFDDSAFSSLPEDMIEIPLGIFPRESDVGIHF